MVGTSVTILPKGVKNLEISLEGYPAISPDIKVLKDKGPGIISGKYRLLDSLVVGCWLRVREVPGSIPSQGPRHTTDVIKMVPVVPLFSTEHSKGKILALSQELR